MTSAQMHRDAQKHAERLPVERPRQGRASCTRGPVFWNPKPRALTRAWRSCRPLSPGQEPQDHG